MGMASEYSCKYKGKNQVLSSVGRLQGCIATTVLAMLHV